MFQALQEQAPDILLQLIKLHKADPRPDKIDVGVGVYRDQLGTTPVFGAVKIAEAQLLEQQSSKSYLGAEGDIGFVERLAPIVFGERRVISDGLWGLQTPGGTGALRLAADLIARANPEATIWLWTPTWPNHPPILRDAGLRMTAFPAYDVASSTLDWAAIENALSNAKAGDALLIQAGCHNPTGADPNADQWRRIGEICQKQGLLPLIDSAYQGLGNGLDEDVAGLRILVDAVDEAIITYSCDKNFGLYRDRVGALWVKSGLKRLEAVRSNLFELARAMWSMPPDHGAAVVRLILESDTLTVAWRSELADMRERINAIRAALSSADRGLSFIANQRGLFAMLPLSPEQVQRLRHEHGIYMAPSGRANLAGLTMQDIPRFVSAMQSVM